MDSSDTIRLIIFLVTLLVSAVFSATEAAFLSIQRGTLAALSQSDPGKARKVERFAGSPEKLLSTVLTGNNLANTAAAAVGTGLALSYFSANTAVIVSTVGVTILLLIFAETIPKTIATRHSVGLATLMSGPLRVVETVLLPPIWVLERVVRGVTRILGLPDTKLVSRDEIIALVNVGRETGTVEPSQAEILGNVFRVEDRQLKEVMTPRTEIVGLKKGATLSEFLQLYQVFPHSRFPVFEGDLDHIVGVLSLKDVVQAIGSQGIGAEDEVTQFAQAPYILPETKMLGEHLRQLKDGGSQIVFLADEYGGIAGLVTLKEIVEEIVGPLGEPGALQEPEFTPLEAGAYQVEGSIDIDEANREMGLGIPEGDYETLAGFMLARLGVIPEEGDRLEHNGFQFDVMEMQGIKIESVKVTRATISEDIVT